MKNIYFSFWSKHAIILAQTLIIALFFHLNPQWYIFGRLLTEKLDFRFFDFWKFLKHEFLHFSLNFPDNFDVFLTPKILSSGSFKKWPKTTKNLVQCHKCTMFSTNRLYLTESITTSGKDIYTHIQKLHVQKNLDGRKIQTETENSIYC